MRYKANKGRSLKKFNKRANKRRGENIAIMRGGWRL